MAELSGHLSADFSSFTKAVDAAVVQLKGFESNAGKVGDSLQKMTDKFSGQKIVQDAILMAEVFDKMGGAVAFTDKQLQQMGKTGAEALDTLKARGAEIPESLQKMVDGTKAVDKATFDWKSTLTSAAGALGIAFSANALKNFVVGVIDAGAQIGDLSQKLGISAEAVQRFGYAASQSGASINTVDSAIKTMNANLAEGSKSTVGALEAAGLKFADIRSLAPERAFVAIADAVAGIEDPMLRAKVATELFGKAGQELLPAFLAGIEEIGAQTRAMSDETIARLTAAQAAWGRLANAITVYSGEAIAETLRVGASWKDFTSSLLVPSWLRPMWREAWADMGSSVGQMWADVSMMTAQVKPGLTDLAERGVKPVAMNAAEAAATIDIMNASLSRVPPVSKAATQEQEKVAASLERMRIEHSQLEQAAARSSQNVAGFGVRVSEVVTINRDFSDRLTESTIKADSFGHVLTTNVEPSLRGMGDATRQAQLRQDEATQATETWRESIDRLSGAFADLGQIGGQGLSQVTRGIGTLIGATNTAFGAVDSLKGAFKSFSSGGLLSGIASLTSGIGGIISVAAAAVSAVKSLWSSVAGGGEQGKVVNPARDAWFGGRSVQDIGDQLGPYMSGEQARKMIEAVFNAKTDKDFKASSGAIDKILGGHSYAAGTGGFKDFGAGTLAMLHGREAVVPESAVRGAGLGGSVIIHINAQGAFFDTPGDLQRLADKVNDALTAKHGLTNRTRAA